MNAISLTNRELARSQARRLLGRAGTRVAVLTEKPQAHRLLLKALPQAMMQRFDASVATDLEAVIELRIRDPHGGPAAPFTIAIDHGRCAITPGAAAQANAGAEIGGDDVVRLVTGAVGWPELLGPGRLTMSGDPFLALRFPLLFRLPAAAAR